MRRSTGTHPNPAATYEDPFTAAQRRIDEDGSEYSWGAGLTPPGTENKGPAEGGRYSTKVPGTRIQ